VILVNVCWGRDAISKMGPWLGADMQASEPPLAPAPIVREWSHYARHRFTSIGSKGRVIVDVLVIHSGPSALQAAIYGPVVIPVGKFPSISFQTAPREPRT